MSKFIVAGANGFIGSQLALGLRNSGHEVINLNIFSESSINNAITLLPARPDPEWVLVNCSSPNEVRIKREASLVIDSLDPIYRLMDFMKSLGLSKLIHFSTIQVFGTELEGEVNMHSPIRIETPYAKVHSEIEDFIKIQCRDAGITSIILRLSNVFGARPESFSKRVSLVPNCFIDELLNDSKITLMTSGKQLRNFLSVNQLVNVIVNISRNGDGKSYTDICASDLYLTVLTVAKICLIQYADVLCKTGDLEISSKIPEKTKQFRLVSQYCDPVVKSADPTKEFEIVVGELFKNEATKRGLRWAR